MGTLVEQPIPTLFGGVSKQPDAVRRPEQVSSADNALMSVVTGGFEKRPPTQHIAALTFLDTTADYAFHAIDRDSSEQYFVMIEGGSAPDIVVLDAITGTQKTVTIGDTKRYFAIENDSLGTGTGILEDDQAVDIVTQMGIASGETTFDWGWKLSDATTGRFKIEGSPDNVTWYDLATGKGGAGSGTFSTTIGAAAANDHNYIRVTTTTGMANASDTVTVWATFKDTTYLIGAASTDIKMSTTADTTFICNRNVETRLSEADSGTVTGTYQTFSKLPAATGGGNIQHVIGDDADGFGSYYVKDDTGSVWVEWYDPTAHNNFDASSMPHKLVRNADGTFTYSACTWASRTAGDEEITPAPDFVGLNINDIGFYRNRLVLAADEYIYCSQAGSVFNLWPEKAVEVLDSDPVARAATTSDINIMKNIAVFRKILFASSNRAQFELTSTGAFTSESATLDLATTYPASEVCRPVVMGDSLYFPGVGAEHATIYEYYFDDTTLSNTAADITKHTEDYIKNDVIQMVADATSNTLFVLTTNDQNRVYVYRTFFDGAEKLQSSWSRYEFGPTESDAFVHGMAVMSGFLVMAIERQDGVIYLEQLPIEREDQDADMGFTPFVDQRQILTGTYDSTNGNTYWVTAWEHTDDAQVILGPSFSEAGIQLSVYYPSRYTLTLATVTAGQTLIIDGLTFTAHATTTTVASRQFSISGNDIADAGELATCLNDATYGMTNATATNNGDGTLTINLDNKLQNDGLSTPTGTAVSGATITVTDDQNIIAASGDYSANQCYVGRDYSMTVELSKFFLKMGETGNTSNITGRLQLKDISLRLVDTGYIKVTVAPSSRTSYDYKFEGKVIGDTAAVGSPTMADTVYRVPIWANARQVTITCVNDQPQPCVVAAAAWRGFFNETTKQG